MATLRRRLLGLGLLAVGVAAFATAATVAPTVVPGSATASGDPDLVVPSPTSLLAAPGLGAVGALALGTGVGTDVGAPFAAFAASEGLATLRAGPPATVAAGTLAGGAVAPVVRASTTEDTIALLAGAVLLLASVAVASADPLALVAGVLAVGALWAVDPVNWRP
ncbi:hypothetical protein DQW50_06215 [Halorubrum sp. 48-1-W]|uniref:hypothetical protein n=1 Tax=Halorubrum sp. 48-1-W TaxID=2249761 RepID=UPI000DCD1D7F|nr:hypothetical protein [Halorubrum sp. 48-1-W]RAW46060.1 hypothetical protein DQW50_06215 [Halorubrum sp. 48-1-W]